MSRNIDVLNPSTYWVGNRCYRVLTHHVDSGSAHYNYAEEDDYAEEAAEFLREGEGEEESHEFSVDKLSNGQYRTAWHVPSAYYAYLIGRKGDTRRRLEAETGSRISIPQRGAGVAEEIVVTGPTVAKVRAGRLKVELLVEQARRKQPLTHFVSIPVNATHVVERFLQFKEAVLEQCSGSLGMCEELFQTPARLHFTIGVLALVDDTERKFAAQVFRDAVETYARDIPDGSLRLRLRGLHYFNDDPHAVRVLYAGVQACDSSDLPEGTSPHLPQQLQNFVDNVANSMIKAGVMRRNKGDSVTLHMTLLNAAFLLPDSDPDAPAQIPSDVRVDPFDASQILEKFGDYDFGEIEMKEVCISLMHGLDKETGGYVHTARMSLAGYPLALISSPARLLDSAV